jgi:hypothetical protein
MLQLIFKHDRFLSIHSSLVYLSEVDCSKISYCSSIITFLNCILDSLSIIHVAKGLLKKINCKVLHHDNQVMIKLH